MASLANHDITLVTPSIPSSLRSSTTPSSPSTGTTPSSISITVADTVQPRNEQDIRKKDEQLSYNLRFNNNTSQRLCKFYAQAKCSHGRYGQNCKFNHLKLCRDFLSVAIIKSVVSTIQ